MSSVLGRFGKSFGISMWSPVAAQLSCPGLGGASIMAPRGSVGKPFYSNLKGHRFKIAAIIGLTVFNGIMIGEMLKK